MKFIFSFFVIAFFLTSSSVNSKWENVSPTGLNLSLYGVHFIDADTGYVTAWNDISTSRILKTTNGGKDWQTITPPASYIFGVNIVGTEKVYVVGYSAADNCGLLYKSTNAGGNWSSLLFNGSDNPASFGYYTYEPVSSSVALMSGYQGSIVKTTDGGTSWTSTNTNTGDVFRVLNFANETTGYAACGAGNDFSVINAIYKTTDGGNNWSILRQRANDISIGNIQFISPDTGFIFCSYNGYASILKTTNGGTSFSESYRGNSGAVFQSGSFFKSTHGIGIGDGGMIVMTKDGGKTWTEQTGVTSQTMIWAHYVDSVTCYIVGLGGEIYKYTDEATDVKETLSNKDNVSVVPNPCSATATFKYRLNKTGWVNLKIYNTLGSMVSEELNEFQTEGNKEFQINLESFGTGVYYYYLQHGESSKFGKIIMVK